MDERKGWWVVLGCFLALIVNAGVGFFVLPIVLESIMEETGWSLTEISLSVTVWGFSAAVISPLLGSFIDRFGARRMMIFGALFMFVSTFAFGSIQSLWQMYLLMLLAPIGSMANTYIAVATVIAHWFEKHRGVATALALLGLGVGGAVIPQVASFVLEEHGWRTTYRVLSFAPLLSLIPVLLWVRNPERLEKSEEEVEKGNKTLEKSII